MVLLKHVISLRLCQLRTCISLPHASRSFLSTQASPTPNPKDGGSMSAWQIYQYGSTKELTLSSTVRIPTLQKPNDILIEVHAASVNPLDVRMRGGYGRTIFGVLRKGLSSLPFIQQDLQPEFPITLGRDFSGIVAATGQNVRKFRIGDEVWGAIRPVSPGSHAQYTVASESEVAKKPKKLTHVEAASIPYVALTTWAALGELTESKAVGQRVLILAGSGGIGSFAIQLMKAWGAEVTTTCSTDAVHLCQSLGADYVIDYKTSNVEEELSKISGFDFILDTIGTNSQRISHTLDLLKSRSNSKYVTIVHPLMKNADDYGFLFGTAKSMGTLGCNVMKGFRGGRNYRWSLYTTNERALGQVSEMVESGQINPMVENVFPFSEVPSAFDKVEEGHARGKTVIDVTKME